MDASYRIIVHLVPRPGHRATLEKAVRDLAAVSRATDVCEQFIVARSLDPPEDLWLIEGFPSREAYAEHVATPHAQTFLHETLPAHVATREVMVVPSHHHAPEDT